MQPHRLAICLVPLLAALAAGSHVPGQAIVKFAAAPGPELDVLLREWRVTELRPLFASPSPLACRMGLDRQYLLVFPAESDVAALVSAFASSPLVEYACPNALLALDSVPDDSLYAEQWHLPDINAPRAWAIAHGDSNVLTAAIGDAAHWTHPDVEDNIAVNAPEDLNGNHRFDMLPPPDGDLDGIDQDGNGYIDDVIGYDFYGGDPIPLPTETAPAGTYCLGVQNAVTDNRVGVAAPPWNVRTYAMRCGDSGHVSLYAAISATYYCMSQNVWTFSLNFGGPTPYEPLREACLAAWAAGLVPCAPTGTDGIEEAVYPAAFEGVVAVASCGRDHRKSPWSSYGTWIDVTAPGDDIYSTSGARGYACRDGNIPACNIVVGILAWIKSAWPSVSNDSAVRILKNMCDTMPDPLYWQGKLGAGRVRMSSIATGIEAGAPAPPSRPAATIVHGTLHVPHSSFIHHSLFDLTGRTVQSIRPGPNDVSRLPPGVYFINVGQSSVRKLVIAE